MECKKVFISSSGWQGTPGVSIFLCRAVYQNLCYITLSWEIAELLLQPVSLLTWWTRCVKPCKYFLVVMHTDEHLITPLNYPLNPFLYTVHTKSHWQYHKDTSQIRINSLNKHFHLFIKLLAFRKENKKPISRRWELCVCVQVRVPQGRSVLLS